MTKIDRRTALAASAATLAAPAFLTASTVPLFAQAAAAAAQAPGFYKYKVGDITVTAINDGFFARPIEGFVRNAELPAVQAALGAAFLPTNAVPIPFNTLVVESGGRLVLLDTGNGNTGAPTSGTWMANFRAAGFDPANVNAVVISHFHGDHINGLRLRDGTAVFPNAEISVPAPEWAFWMSDERMNAAPEAMRGGFQNARRVFSPIAANVKRYEPGAEVAPGITSVAAFGHSPGHTVFVVASGTAKLIYMADTSNHPALFVRNPDWSAVFDMDADAARATRRRLLDMAASEKSRVHFYHAPFPANGFIAKDGNGFQLVPAQWTPSI
ncbi:MAG: MBL fold metallo-hydrolase [Phreatobacter sp.]|uniref:MBL fold metallo-hydrolase n=1 Tax=Phreatobacter sp. TaxID=1966341 RepID=UPI002737110F|nr:MBL fold metallo-hydrolase [Phreatobacter sp.]MDP2800558.1 MBL fold metallo-hydrolase [Phreatobacter sp.]